MMTMVQMILTNDEHGLYTTYVLFTLTYNYIISILSFPLLLLWTWIYIMLWLLSRFIFSKWYSSVWFDTLLLLPLFVIPHPQEHHIRKREKKSWDLKILKFKWDFFLPPSSHWNNLFYLLLRYVLQSATYICRIY